ncbi:uncharacterized protein LOC112057930 [Bicyclus anynana]|uniref:Uncharacterized protein LOC112057930 n=1 Tax=Bicyclus anynana TaxID=110368 RepID=A0A6J1P936_BICAN|nr:uncharacterized protein LOC112057930 [Bicyclus anynana]
MVYDRSLYRIAFACARGVALRSLHNDCGYSDSYAIHVLNLFKCHNLLTVEMKKSTSVILLAVLISQTQSAPQFLTFKDGKIGVNFGGYHAGVGFGGLFGGNAAGGLYAEAGTPHGQSAIAGLGGGAGQNGGSAGGLFAGATAGNGINAQAGLAGGTNVDNSASGTGFASAQAGNNYAATGMGGAASVEGSSGYSFSASKGVKPVEVKPIHKKVHTEINIDSINEVRPVEVEKKVIHETVPPVVVKEVYVAPKTAVVEKEIIHTHYKPRRHHFRKTAFLGGYVGGQGDIVGPPQIQKRIDVDVDSAASAHAGVAAEGHINGGVGSTYHKEVTVEKNPTFFADIFNIPISTLKAVGNFLGNTAANTHVSVEKSAHIQADSDAITSKHAPLSSSPSSSSSAHISVETPSASKFIDDILAIPINTLSAVNKFLENNVPARKSVQVSGDGAVESRVRLGPARRRANKHVVVVKEETPVETVTEQ